MPKGVFSPGVGVRGWLSHTFALDAANALPHFAKGGRGIDGPAPLDPFLLPDLSLDIGSVAENIGQSGSVGINGVPSVALPCGVNSPVYLSHNVGASGVVCKGNGLGCGSLEGTDDVSLVAF